VSDEAPILGFDPTPIAVIEPSEVIEPMSIAPHAVLCFFQDVIADVVERHGGRVIDHVVSEIGRNPIYEIDHGGRRLVVMHPGVGAPLAAGFLEELIARGCRSFVACGGAGVLVPDVALGHVIVPTSAVREEGTSYHYLPPSRTAEPTAAAVDAIVETAERHGVPHVRGATWTTDALYRERQDRRPGRGGLPHGRDGSRGVLRRRGVPRGHLRPGAVRGRRPLGRGVGPARLGRAHERARDPVPHRRGSRAAPSPRPAAHGLTGRRARGSARSISCATWPTT
jgi:uridine phosphorylase